jgi:thiol-disulfide isomerase/thioredoxin
MMKQSKCSRPRRASIRRWAGVGIVAVLAVLIGSIDKSATAQSAAGALRDFHPFTTYVLAVDGAEAPDAKIYYSETARAFLVFEERFPAPVLIRPRRSSVETVSPAKVAEREDGTIDLLPAPELAAQEDFRVVEDRLVFTIDGTRAALKPRPPLLGLQSVAALTEYDPEYARRAQAYTPSEATLTNLLSEREDVRVRVYFGTWCPHCKEAVPRAMRIDEGLEGSRIHFEYYGVPARFSQDPEARRAKVKGVPTAVVFRGGREIGRLTGNAWKSPELALSMMLLH